MTPLAALNRLPRTALRPPSGAALWIGGGILLLLLYAFVFVETSGEGVGVALVDASANVVPLAMLAAATRALLRAQVMPRSVPVQAAAHAGLAVAFATTWYALILVALAFAAGVRGQGWAVSGFSGPAFTWQVFQGLIMYALVAATCYAIRGGREAATLTIVAAPPLERYLTRTGDEIRPVSVRDIVSITGAQDYAEVVTLGGCHLVRMSLAEFERRLDPARFVRVHRSTIVNLDHLRRAESAGGGRLLAHMANGESVPVSRAGAQTLKALIV